MTIARRTFLQILAAAVVTPALPTALVNATSAPKTVTSPVVDMPPTGVVEVWFKGSNVRLPLRAIEWVRDDFEEFIIGGIRHMRQLPTTELRLNVILSERVHFFGAAEPEDIEIFSPVTRERHSTSGFVRSFEMSIEQGQEITGDIEIILTNEIQEYLEREPPK